MRGLSPSSSKVADGATLEEKGDSPRLRGGVMKRTTLALALSLLVASSAFAAPGDGDLWEVTSQMKVEGMPPGYQMPARTNEVCRAKVWDKPPVAADDQRKCEFLDFKNTAGTSTWKMRCVCWCCWNSCCGTISW